MKQKINCDIRVVDLECWKGKDIFLPANKTYELAITYPFEKHGIFEIQTGDGMGLFGILSHIRKGYANLYKNAKKDKNGYWHAVEDLTIEGITVDHDKNKITLYVGS